jgi:hypothetical protein
LILTSKIKVDVKSEVLTKEMEELIERALIDIGFVLIKYAERWKSLSSGIR